jgi:peptide/nickel transport system substrate-binding protein
MRQAAALAVNREGLVEKFFGSYAHIFDAAYPAGSPLAADVEPIRLDLDRARALVQEAGHADGVKVQAIATNVAPAPKVAEAVAGDLARIGIHLDVRGYDDPPWWPLIYIDTDWQAAFQGMGPRAHPDILFRREYMTGGTFNPVGYSNAELDDLIRHARITIDDEHRTELYRQAQRLLRQDLPYLPLYVNEAPAGWRFGIIGFGPHPLGYWDLTETRDTAWR